MRRVIYSCAMSLDGYIAGPGGDFDWIVTDPEMDFKTMMARFDTYLVGRKTYEMMQASGQAKPSRRVRHFVFSRTLEPSAHPGVTVASDPSAVVPELRAQSGKEIWLFGGGELFRSMLAAGLVDSVEVAVIPILLGGGIPLLPAPAARAALRLRRHRFYEKTGIVSLEYDVGAVTRL